MLATPARGITGGKWFSLIDKLYPVTTRRAAFEAVVANRGAAEVDHVGIEHYAANLDANLARHSPGMFKDAHWPMTACGHRVSAWRDEIL